MAFNVEPIPDNPLVGISACLTGQNVRYDGTNKRLDIVSTTMAPFLQLLPICPEAACGLGIPRPPVNLVIREEKIYALGRDDPTIDITEKLLHFGSIIARVYPNLCGFIIQSRSPSCGYGSTPVYGPAGSVTYPGDGLFIQQLVQSLPWLPLIDDNQVKDANQRKLFLLKAVTLQDWHTQHSQPTDGNMVDFIKSFLLRYKNRLSAEEFDSMTWLQPLFEISTPHQSLPQLRQILRLLFGR